MSDINLLTEAGDFKLLSRRAVNELIKFKEKNPFLRGMVTWIGFNQVSIHYQREARYAGATKFPIFSRKVIRNFFNSALISFSDLPLQAISWLGLIVSICAFVYSAYVILEKVRGHNIPGWTAIMVTMLFLGGVELLAIGVLGLYINSIFVESKQRPNYIIKDKFGF
ncbi:hypothetical protein V2H45_16760 [Tumidithrix elongata RA019]|uniref:Glycosyltransferase n=1 Tax=Tumidithrix elongata BACA0141 TaxID=2716417 RepID=A0AAW9Q3D3_9CYAN|nr:hypothetical protein [Tumidithrix elongata RA019]